MPLSGYDVFISGAEYGRADTLGLTLEVNSSTKVYNIEVERYVSKGRR